MITTYAVYGKMEYVISLTIGSKSVPVDFNGGSISARGNLPATYTTNNPILQRGIEASNEYKIGIIKKIRSLTEDIDLIAAEKIKAAQKESQEDAPAAEAAENTAPEAEAPAATPEPAAIVPEAPAPVETPKTEVQVTCHEDAVEYLKAHYEGYSSTKLRSKAAVMQAAEEHNLIFVGL